MLKPILALVTAVTLAGTMLPHADLKSSIPAKNAMVPSPKAISLTFTEGVTLQATSISILKADSSLVERLVVKFLAGDTTVAGTVTEALMPGTYIIKWKNGAADDGHVSTGAFPFMVMAQ